MIRPEELMKVKARGFLRNRGTELFSGRVVPAGTVFTAADFAALAELAERFGSGKLICTSRQTVEIPGIAFESIEKAEAFAAAHGLAFGGTGAKIRPINACKGTTCVFGNIDTQGLAKDIHKAYYEGWRGVTLPHKFKIGIGGCPNSCIKPSLNDFGVEGCKTPVYTAELCRGCKACAVEKTCPMKAATLQEEKLQIDRVLCRDCGMCTGKCPFGAVAKEVAPRYRIFVGGTWGKHCRMGTELSRLVEEGEVMPILEKCLLWFRRHGYAKERFGKTIDRVGIESLEAAVFSEDILAEKDAILAADLLTRT